MVGKKIMSDLTVDIVKLMFDFKFILNTTAVSFDTVSFETSKTIIVSRLSSSPI
jgi:hypothetical protein